MNLNLYDDVVEYIDRTRTWVCTRRQCIFSREITYRRYFMLTKRYNPSSRTTQYFLITLDTKPENRHCKPLKVDSYGRVVASVKDIWTTTALVDIEKDCNITGTIDCGSFDIRSGK